MADIDLYIPFLEKWEGGFAHHPADRGGATCKGVTLDTWKRVGVDKNGDGTIDVLDLRLIGRHDLVERVLRPHFWNRWQADRIRTQAIAEVLVDWMWMSGPYTIRLAQKELAVEMDGVVGNRTLHAINSCIDQHNLFYRLKVARYAHLYRIVGHRPENKVFLDGWLNRVRDLKFSLCLAALVVALASSSCRSQREVENSLANSKLTGASAASEQAISTADSKLTSVSSASEQAISTANSKQLVSYADSSVAHRKADVTTADSAALWMDAQLKTLTETRAGVFTNRTTELSELNETNVVWLQHADTATALPKGFSMSNRRTLTLRLSSQQASDIATSVGRRESNQQWGYINTMASGQLDESGSSGSSRLISDSSASVDRREESSSQRVDSVSQQKASSSRRNESVNRWKANSSQLENRNRSSASRIIAGLVLTLIALAALAAKFRNRT